MTMQKRAQGEIERLRSVLTNQESLLREARNNKDVHEIPALEVGLKAIQDKLALKGRQLASYSRW